jgi:hypothetical protein
MSARTPGAGRDRGASCVPSTPSVAQGTGGRCAGTTSPSASAAHQRAATSIKAKDVVADVPALVSIRTVVAGAWLTRPRRALGRTPTK